MSATEAPPSGGNGWVGQAIKRKEDPPLITGQGRYVDDLQMTGVLHAAFVRSPEAHANITSIDTSAAAARDDVVAVFTGEDLDFLAPLPMVWAPPGVEINTPEHHPLTSGTVRHVGDPVAVVVGTDKYSVIDATEDVIVEYEPLPVVVDPEEALARSRGSSTSTTGRTRPTSGRWAAATSSRASPRPTSSSSGASSTTAPPGRPSSRARVWPNGAAAR